MPAICMKTAIDLILLRIAICDAGKIGLTVRDDVEINLTLPGNGTVARFIRAASGEVAQLFRPDGMPLSLPLDLTDPVAFASFMHNVDCEMLADGKQPAKFSRSDVPYALLAFADAAYVSKDPAVRREADVLCNLDPMTLPLDSGKSPPSPYVSWHISERAAPLLDAALSTRDWACQRAAKMAELANNTGYNANHFSDRTSQIGWLSTVQAWADPEPEEERVDGASRKGDYNFHWVLLRAPIDRAVESFGLKVTGGEVEAMAEGDADASFWSLRDEYGSTMGIAVIHGGEMSLSLEDIHPEETFAAAWENVKDGVLAELADYTGVSTPYAAPAPR